MSSACDVANSGHGERAWHVGCSTTGSTHGGFEMRSLIVAAAFLTAVVLPCSARADVEVASTAVPSKDWQVGTGIGFNYTIGLAGIGSQVPVTSLAGLAGPPSVTVLVERRLGERTFLSFQGGLGYSVSQSETTAASGKFLSVQGQLGVRRVLNPGSLIEVSCFGNASVAWVSGVSRQPGAAIDPNTGMSTSDLTDLSTHTLNLNAFAGLTFERELVDGLALRFSSSVLGLGYALGGTSTVNPFVNTSTESHGFNVGLHFSPTLELRYRF